MKKAMFMIALAAISFGSVYAVPVKPMQTDTTVKIKKHHGKMKIKKKVKDTTTMKM